jgi:transcriptional regulator with GAF, ATPase, and Fis domain
MQTTDLDQRSWTAPQSQPTLRLLYFSDGGVIERPTRVLHPGEVRIGREVTGEADIALPMDRCASRVHAIVQMPAEGAAVRIVESGSRNGTFVNGKRVAECELQDNDVVRVGNSLFLLRHLPAAVADAEVPGLLGSAPPMCQLRHTVAQAAGSGATVLLLGESGTGKEVAAQALHQLRGRKGPLVAVNCAAIAESLAESLLFGHVPGAFTGARTAQDGYFRSAHGGTLFLDELGELPPALQAKLLRVLEEQKVTPVGATRSLPVDVWLIAATNRDLIAGVGAGSFRGDLYARLAQVIVRLPPLRERREDILTLLLHFLPAPTPRLSSALAEALLLHPWPFNVRELRQLAAILKMHAAGASELEVPLVAEHLASHARVSAKAVAQTAQREHATTEDAPPSAKTPDSGDPKDHKPRPSREALEALLREHRGNVSLLARHFGRSRRQIDRWLEHYGLTRKSFLP